MIDLATESLVSVSQAARLLPSAHETGTVNPATVWRWINKGCVAPSGEVVKLDAMRIGGRLVTSREAVQRFAQTLTGTPVEVTPKPRTPTKRDAAGKRAGKRLEEAGI